MRSFPSNLPFVSFLQYSPRGSSSVSKKSRALRDAIKNDWKLGNVEAIPYAALRLAQEFGKHTCLAKVLGPDVTLVPIPRSSPMQKGSLWPPLRICTELVRQGMGKEVQPLITRTSPVPKSATSANRPDPPHHDRSIRVENNSFFETPERITLVDDFVTRGSTFIGMYPKVRECFPNAEILCFALVRTMSYGDVHNLVDPIEGTMKYEKGVLDRSP